MIIHLSSKSLCSFNSELSPWARPFSLKKSWIRTWKFVPTNWPWQSCGHVIKISIQSIVYACCGNIQDLLALIFVQLTWRGLNKTRLVSETRVGFLISGGQDKDLSIMWNKYLWDCCCCWRPIEPAELTGTRGALNIRNYQNFPFRIFQAMMAAPLSGHTFAVDPASWDQQLREVGEQWICLKSSEILSNWKRGRGSYSRG